MKYVQRDSLTRERQTCLATGAGPPVPHAKINPEISAIVPHLMVTAPKKKSSNIPRENENSFVETILEQANDNETLVEEYLAETEEFLINENPMTIEDLSNFPVVNKRSISPASQSEDEKVRRMAGLCQQDKVSFEMKLQHELKVEQMTERHLDIMHNMQQEHLREMHKRELRKAEAEAQLAELRLAREISSLEEK